MCMRIVDCVLVRLFWPTGSLDFVIPTNPFRDNNMGPLFEFLTISWRNIPWRPYWFVKRISFSRTIFETRSFVNSEPILLIVFAFLAGKMCVSPPPWIGTNLAPISVLRGLFGWSRADTWLLSSVPRRPVRIFNQSECCKNWSGCINSRPNLCIDGETLLSWRRLSFDGTNLNILMFVFDYKGNF